MAKHLRLVKVVLLDDNLARVEARLVGAADKAGDLVARLAAQKAPKGETSRLQAAITHTAPETEGTFISTKIGVFDPELAIIARSHDLGTGIHAGKGTYPIPPRNPGGVLSFQWKWAPPEIVERYGSTEPWVVFPMVMHPGVPARHFFDEAFKDADPSIVQFIQEAMMGK